MAIRRLVHLEDVETGCFHHPTNLFASVQGNPISYKALILQGLFAGEDSDKPAVLYQYPKNLGHTLLDIAPVEKRIDRAAFVETFG